MNQSIRQAVLAGSLLLATSALGAQGQSVQQWFCTRVSGGPIHDLTILVDVGAKTLSVSPDGWISPDPGFYPVTFKDDLIAWSFMRGYAELNLKTRTLEWDDTGEESYLGNVGHADANDSGDNYRGKMRCTASGQ